MPRHSIEVYLTPDHWKEFVALASDRRSTLKFLVQWLRDRGYTMSRSGVHRFRASRIWFDCEEKGDELSELFKDLKTLSERELQIIKRLVYFMAKKPQN